MEQEITEWLGFVRVTFVDGSEKFHTNLYWYSQERLVAQYIRTNPLNVKHITFGAQEKNMDLFKKN